MTNASLTTPHLFHIPVMGTGFSVDTPLKVACYGISSVVSIMDDELAERMRETHSRLHNISYTPIDEDADDKRARRITAYLNLLNDLVAARVSEVRTAPFEEGSEISRYFDLLPDGALKGQYRAMLAHPGGEEKLELQERLRRQIVAGSIDVNIMTKVDADAYDERRNKLPPESADAMAALRGFARSDLRSSVVFSAGLNRRLYAYLTTFEEFFPDSSGVLRKKIVLKVSDYRSAIIQGKYLAKRGLWVSEYRIESGLNCGGHAFATEGHLLGPIMEEFARKKTEMIDELRKTYYSALRSLGYETVEGTHGFRITVQGGIGTVEEQRLLFERYAVDGVGWGTPFLLAPEVTNVDDEHLQKLADAGEDDVSLSDHSPLGVPFWSLENSASEERRRSRITNDRPGSPCPKGFLVSNTEFTTEPICSASRNYQRRKVRQLGPVDQSCERVAQLRERTLAKSCLCLDLAGSAMIKHKIITEAQPAVCCGPNIVNFSRVVTMDELIDHIYGRCSLLSNPDRPHMFIRELSLYVDYFRKEFQLVAGEFSSRTAKRFLEFKRNLKSGIEHYRELAERFDCEQRELFIAALDALCSEIDVIHTGTEEALSDNSLAQPF